jgi:hypothetical protein
MEAGLAWKKVKKRESGGMMKEGQAKGGGGIFIQVDFPQGKETDYSTHTRIHLRLPSLFAQHSYFFLPFLCVLLAFLQRNL